MVQKNAYLSLGARVDDDGIPFTWVDKDVDEILTPKTECVFDIPDTITWQDFRSHRHHVDTREIKTVLKLRQHIVKELDIKSYGLLLCWGGQILHDGDTLQQIIAKEGVEASATSEITIILDTENQLWNQIKDSLQDKNVEINLTNLTKPPVANGFVFAVQRETGYILVRANLWTTLREVAQAFQDHKGELVHESVYFHARKAIFDGPNLLGENGYPVKTLSLAGVGPGSVVRLLRIRSDLRGGWTYG